MIGAGAMMVFWIGVTTGVTTAPVEWTTLDEWAETPVGMLLITDPTWAARQLNHQPIRTHFNFGTFKICFCCFSNVVTYVLKPKVVQVERSWLLERQPMERGGNLVWQQPKRRGQTKQPIKWKIKKKQFKTQSKHPSHQTKFTVCKWYNFFQNICSSLFQ